MPSSKKQRLNRWKDRYWGESYRYPSKINTLETFLHQLKAAGQLGTNILNIGAGASPTTRELEGCRVIEIDCASSENFTIPEEYTQIRLDVEELPHNTKATRRAILKTAAFLNIDCDSNNTLQHIDTIVFSDILNYVDYKTVITALLPFLKNGGRIIIWNTPEKGIPALLSKKGVQNNDLLVNFLKTLGLTIETLSYPLPPDGTPPELDQILLVARKLT